MDEKGKTVRYQCSTRKEDGHSMVRKGNSNFFQCKKCGNELPEERIRALLGYTPEGRKLVTILEYSKLHQIDRRKIYRLIQAGRLTLYRGLRNEPMLDPEQLPLDDMV